MKVRLKRDIHLSWLKKGMIGKTYKDNEGYTRFIPESYPEDYGFDKINGAYISEDDIESIR